MSVPPWRRLLGGVLAALLAGCSRTDAAAKATAEPAPVGSGASASSAPLVLAPSGIRFVKAGTEDDLTISVRAERDRAKSEGRELLVYIGAKWCEPCQRFHVAAQRGELDAEFPNLTILELDLDVDRDRINLAGYDSSLIPLFVIPGPDGRGTNRRVEGGVKGDSAVANLAPRLHAILASGQ